MPDYNIENGPFQHTWESLQFCPVHPRDAGNGKLR